MNRAIRVTLYLALLFVVLCAAGISALRVHANHARQHGEQLQEEVLKLVPGVTTLAEVRTFVSRTERPEGYEAYGGPCDESSCDVSVGTEAFGWLWNGPLERPLQLFGVRAVVYGAIVAVRDGKVRRVNMYVFHRPRHTHVFTVSTIAVEHFSPEDLRSATISKLDPARAFCAAAIRNEEGQQFGSALVMGAATSTGKKQTKLDFSCVTSVRGCANPADLVSPAGMVETELQSRNVACPALSRSSWWTNWGAGQYPH